MTSPKRYQDITSKEEALIAEKKRKQQDKDRSYLETVPEELRSSSDFRSFSRRVQKRIVREYEKREKKEAKERDRLYSLPENHKKRTGGSIRKRTGGSIESYSAQVKRKYGGGKI